MNIKEHRSRADAGIQKEVCVNIKLSRDKTVAVDHTYFWQPMSSCPLGCKVQLLTSLGVAIYGKYSGNPDGWDGWAPLPKRRKHD